MMALALDFDGVISDSARESFAVALESLLRMRPDSPLREHDRDDLFRQFVERMPLGNRAEDYGATLLAIEQGVALPDQRTYDRYRREQNADWLGAYHERFYAVRRELSRADPAAWRDLMAPYPRFRDLLLRRAGQVGYAIATSKDRPSVDALLSHYGIAGLFPAALILDKELGENKAAHLRELSRRMRIEPNRITFVDDKVNHLDRVAPLGVRCALAGWGYNGPRERRLATEAGYLVLSLEDAEEQLFGS